MKINWKLIAVAISQAFFLTSVIFFSNKAYEEASKAYCILTEIKEIFNAHPDLPIDQVIIGVLLFIVAVGLAFVFILFNVGMNLIQQFINDCSTLNKNQMEDLSEEKKSIIKFVEKHPYCLSSIVIFLSLIIIWRVLAMP